MIEVLAMGFSILIFTILMGWQEGRKRETVRIVLACAGIPVIVGILIILIAGNRPYNPYVKIGPKNKAKSLQPKGMEKPDWSENSAPPKELSWITEARRLKRLEDKKQLEQ